jgi:hemerythrin superfamily protein
MYELLEHLKEEHQKLEMLLGKLENKTARAASSRMELFTKLKKDIIPHMKSEEEILYKRCMEAKNAKLKELTLEAYEEHRVVSMLLVELDKMDKANEVWGARFKVFAENVRHHVEEEEGTFFPEVEKRIGSMLPGMMQMYEMQEEKIRRKVAA